MYFGSVPYRLDNNKDQIYAPGEKKGEVVMCQITTNIWVLGGLHVSLKLNIYYHSGLYTCYSDARQFPSDTCQFAHDVYVCGEHTHGHGIVICPGHMEYILSNTTNIWALGIRHVLVTSLCKFSIAIEFHIF